MGGVSLGEQELGMGMIKTTEDMYEVAKKQRIF